MMQAIEFKAIMYAVEDRIAVIRLNRPHRLNAWTGRMHTEYRSALLLAEQNPGVRVIVVTGEGKGFCAGADTQALEGHIAKGGYDPGTPDTIAQPGFGVRPEFDAAFAYHFGLTKPVIAAINGPAAGVGLVLACFADIRFAVPGVKLTTAHGKLNLPAEFGLSWLLPRLIGLARATEILLSSRVVMTEEALEIGLVNRIYPAEELMTGTLQYAKELADSVSPGSLRQTKRQIYTDLHRDLAASVDESEQLVRSMMKEADFKEGVAALTGKRSPHWGVGVADDQ